MMTPSEEIPLWGRGWGNHDGRMPLVIEGLVVFQHIPGEPQGRVDFVPHDPRELAADQDVVHGFDGMVA